ncbi:helix-turn-helix domain-containing protein [Candidatus Soleaferrea massiliensis]|uniref:helix-turn-helix domain-containing protein n=1 Tax=Candidatus Soleaferrea massiliensis TaxID=1470354 RepID=UPI00058BEA5E|nr:XRE family transcriptional regulator [Candidatus Soleaferrea massiliensis]
MDYKIKEVAQRIKGLREILDISQDEMAEVTGVSAAQYERYEAGECDFSFTFLYKCAERFGVDIIEILTGDKPKLHFYNIVRKGQGLPINRRAGFSYQHLAHLFQNKLAEPFLVTVPYCEEEQNKPIELSYHDGQEFDYIISGSLKVQMESHEEILHAGDSVYYDSSHGHGMIAAGGEPCVFLAIILKKQSESEE